MTGYLALLRLQLISRFADWKPRNLRSSMSENKGKAVWRGIGILVLILYLGGMLFTVERAAIDFLMKAGTPDLMVSIVVVMTMMSTLIMSFFYIMSSLFLGRDAGFLAALPVKPRTVLCAKLTQVWVSETLVSAVLLLPACILYGVRTGVGADFYLRLAVVWLLVDVIPISIVALVSTLLIRLSALWKHREMLTTVFGIGFLMIYMYGAARMGSISADSDEGMEIIGRFLTNYGTRIDMMTGSFLPARWAVRGLMGDYGMLGLFALTCIAAAAVSIWLVGLVYRKLSLLQTETPMTGSRSKAGRRERYTDGSPLRACMKREMKTILRVPSYATNILPTCFMPLFMVIIMTVVMSNAAEGEESVQMLLGSLPGTLVTAILAAVMAYMCGINPALSTAVTREGKGHDLMKSLPVPGWTVVRSKFFVGYGIGAAGVICAGIALAVIVPQLLMPVLLACLLCLLFCWTASCLALIRDIKKPKLDWMTEQQAVKQNFGVLISMLESWGMLAVLAVASYFLISADVSLWLYFGIMAAALGGCSLLAWAWLKKTAGKYYFQN